MKIRSYVCALVFLFLSLADTAVAQQPASVNSCQRSSQNLTALGQIAACYAPVEVYWLNMRATAWGYAVKSANQGLLGSHSNATVELSSN